MTNKQDEGMTVEKAKEVIEKQNLGGIDGVTGIGEREFCKGFLQGWDARGWEDCHVIDNYPDITVNDLARIKDEILKLQSEGEK